jgi:hypothetical protein
MNSGSLYPIELLTTVKELEKYNEKLYCFVKSYGFNMKPKDRVLIIMIPGFLAIYILSKNDTQKYVTNFVDIAYLKDQVDYFYNNKKWEEENKNLRLVYSE